MQFVKQEDGSSPAFSVWSIEKTFGDQKPNKMKSGPISGMSSIWMRFRLLLPFLLSGVDFFEFKFYR